MFIVPHFAGSRNYVSHFAYAYVSFQLNFKFLISIFPCKFWWQTYITQHLTIETNLHLLIGHMFLNNKHNFD